MRTKPEVGTRKQENQTRTGKEIRASLAMKLSMSSRKSEGTNLARAVSIVILLAVLGVWGTAYGQAIKVGDEVVLMAAGPGGARRGKTAVAFGKDVFLAAWQDGWHGLGGSSRIYVIRVGLDGKPLDAKAVEIAPCKTGVQENPRVAFFPSAGSGRAGGNFLVVWQDMRNGKDCDILGARISPDGEVLDARPITIAAAPRTQAMPDVAADGKGFMIVWHGFRGEEVEAKVFARRVGADGAAGETAVVSAGSSPRIAWNGKEHLVVYSNGFRSGAGITQMKAWQRMDMAGKPLSKRRILHRFFVEGPIRYSIGAMPEGKGWVIVSHGGSPNFWHRSVGAQLATSITPDGKLAADMPSGKTYDPKTKKRMIPANWLDTSVGKKVHSTRGSAHIAAVWPYGGSAVARDGRYCVAVWQRYKIGGRDRVQLSNGDVRASRLDGWKPLDGDGGVPVAASAAEELNPALAGNGAGKLLCVYEKMKDGRSSIAARSLHTR